MAYINKYPMAGLVCFLTSSLVRCLRSDLYTPPMTAMPFSWNEDTPSI